MNFEMAQIHFRFPNSVSAIEIFVNDINDLMEIKKQILQISLNH
jgi:ABC-type lipoprotein release transport system permease subunit